MMKMYKKISNSETIDMKVGKPYDRNAEIREKKMDRKERVCGQKKRDVVGRVTAIIHCNECSGLQNPRKV